jgi:hypothetical protein
MATGYPNLRRGCPQSNSGESPSRTDLPIVFVSYYRADKYLAFTLVKHLKVLEIQQAARVFWDHATGGGERWEARLIAEIDQAAIAILLLSTDYLISPYIYETELPRLLTREGQGLRIIPVLLRPCPWHLFPRIAELQLETIDGEALSLRSTGEIEESFCRLVLRIADLILSDPDPDHWCAPHYQTRT